MMSSESKPLISIIIPTYKRHKEQVELAVLSALNQSYENIEVIIIDDNASMENANFREEIKEMVKRLNDKKIKCIFNENNLGGALSRNVGVDNSNGKYISFLDDDDVYLPKKIEHQYLHMIQHSLDVSITDLYIYNNENKIIDIRKFDLKSFDNKSLKKYHLTKQLVGTPRFLFKRDVLTDIGGFDDAIMGQEWFLIDKIINKNKYKFGYIPICDIKVYRTKGESISNSLNKLIGEKKIYETKMKYSSILNWKERRYLRFRHYVIVCVAYKRNHRFLQFILYAFMVVTHFPLNIIKEIIHTISVKKSCKKLNKNLLN